MLTVQKQDEKQAELLRSVLDCTTDGVVVVDEASEASRNREGGAR